jgi:hypothetical protein
METSESASVVERQLDREIGLIADAIAMVARGGSPRVTVAGLRLGEAVLGPAEELAEEAGVRVVPRWNAGEAGVDIAVERRTASE